MVVYTVLYILYSPPVLLNLVAFDSLSKIGDDEKFLDLTLNMECHMNVAIVS